LQPRAKRLHKRPFFDKFEQIHAFLSLKTC
jgi:hypothetical protein